MSSKSLTTFGVRSIRSDIPTVGIPSSHILPPSTLILPYVRHFVPSRLASSTSRLQYTSQRRGHNEPINDCNFPRVLSSALNRPRATNIRPTVAVSCLVVPLIFSCHSFAFSTNKSLQPSKIDSHPANSPPEPFQGSLSIPDCAPVLDDYHPSSPSHPSAFI